MRGCVGKRSISLPLNVILDNFMAPNSSNTFWACNTELFGGMLSHVNELIFDTPHCASSIITGAKSASIISGLRCGNSFKCEASLHKR